jgi:hypothetical protein
MMGTKTFALGAQIFMGDGGAPEVFTKIPGPTDFDYTPPQPERMDVTDHDSLAREYLQGLLGDGEVTSEFFYQKDEPMHLALRDKHGESQNTNFYLLTKSGTQIDFEATVAIRMTLATTDAERMAVTWAISGLPQYTD